MEFSYISTPKLTSQEKPGFEGFFLFPQTTHAVGNIFFFLNDIYQQSWILPRCQDKDTNQNAPISSETDSPRLMSSEEPGHNAFSRTWP